MAGVGAGMVGAEIAASAGSSRDQSSAASARSSPDQSFAVSAHSSPDKSFAVMTDGSSPDRGGVRRIITGIGLHRMPITGMRVIPMPAMTTTGMGVIRMPATATMNTERY